MLVCWLIYCDPSIRVRSSFIQQLANEVMVFIAAVYDFVRFQLVNKVHLLVWQLIVWCSAATRFAARIWLHQAKLIVADSPMCVGSSVGVWVTTAGQLDWYQQRARLSTP